MIEPLSSPLLPCEKCGRETRTCVVDSRFVASQKAIRRRRECLECQSRFTTYEHVAGEANDLIATHELRSLRERANAFDTIARVLPALREQVAASAELLRAESVTSV